MKQPTKPKNAPENIEWNSSLKLWMALIHTTDKGEEVWHYWNKHGYLFAAITYDKDDKPIKNQQFPPEGTDKNAVYVVPFDKWVVPNQIQKEPDEKTATDEEATMEQPTKPKNAPENIEWNDSLKFWMAIIDTNEKGEVTLNYWNKQGYLYSEAVYDSNNVMIGNRQFPPEGVAKNAGYVPFFDTWVTPENPLSEKQQSQLLEAYNKFEQELAEKVKQEAMAEVKQELAQELESIKLMTDENSEFNTIFSAIKQIGEAAKEVNAEAKIPKSDFESFRISLIYGFDDLFCDFAGGKTLGVDDSDVKYKSKNRIYPESGDWVFYDKRCQAGTFGVSHDDFSIRKVTLKNPQEHQVDYSLPKIKRAVSTQKLNERYVWLAFFFCNWEHRVGDSPFNMDWGRKIASFSENVTALNKTFNKEIKQLKDDPYLAIYWLLHMGICCDDRYQQVKQQVIELKLNQTAVNGDDYMLESIQQCLVFFEQLGDYQNLSLDTKYSKLQNKKLFLERRSFVVYLTQSCLSDNKNHLEKWWLSVFIYPKLSKKLVFRIYWLRKNLVVHNQWDKFDEKIQAENIAIENPTVPLLSYVLASHPNIADKSKYADLFLAELHANKNLWSENDHKSFIGTMLWNLKELFTKTDLLQEVMDFYFFGRFDDEKYQEIYEYHFGKDESAEKIQTAEKQLTTIMADTAFSFEKDEQLAINQQALANSRQFLADFTNEEIAKLTKVAKSLEVGYALFEYILVLDIDNKNELLTFLGENWSKKYSQNNSLSAFMKNYIRNEEDSERIETLLHLVNSIEGSWIKSLGFAFMDNLHKPKIFQSLLAFLTTNKAEEDSIKEFVKNVFGISYDDDYNDIIPIEKLNKEQINQLLETCLQAMFQFFETMETPTFNFYDIIEAFGAVPLGKEALKKVLENWQEIEKRIPEDMPKKQVRDLFERSY